jgi:hypothetical protein
MGNLRIESRLKAGISGEPTASCGDGGPRQAGYIRDNINGRPHDGPDGASKRRLAGSAALATRAAGKGLNDVIVTETGCAKNLSGKRVAIAGRVNLD